MAGLERKTRTDGAWPPCPLPAEPFGAL